MSTPKEDSLDLIARLFPHKEKALLAPANGYAKSAWHVDVWYPADSWYSSERWQSTWVCKTEKGAIETAREIESGGKRVRVRKVVESVISHTVKDQ